MKTSHKILVLSLALSNVHVDMQANFARKALHKVASLSIYAGLAQSAHTIYRTVEARKGFAQLPDAHPDAAAFCRKRFVEHGIDPATISIKQNNETIQAVVTGYLFLGPEAEQLLQQKNASQEQPSEDFRVQSTLLDHEIAHLKHHDDLRSLALNIATGLVQYRTSSYIAHSSRIKHWFSVPKNLRSCATMLLAYGLLTGMGIQKNNWIRKKHGQYNEIRSDVYAIGHAKDPENLRSVARYFKNYAHSRGFIESALSEKDKRQQKALLKELDKMLRNYKQEHPEDLNANKFPAWLVQTPERRRKLFQMFDPHHENPEDRAKRFMAGADELEKRLKMQRSAPFWKLRSSPLLKPRTSSVLDFFRSYAKYQKRFKDQRKLNALVRELAEMLRRNKRAIMAPKHPIAIDYEHCDEDDADNETVNN